ncbi:excisionase family DNA binding protein [Bradyrhizobium ottawaense]|uniref:helix-turn-helix domain-containing protein n=1 Tax=Bradyrhizobium ottawaense TaxID=931866 RepID=UPI00351939D4
MHKSVELPPPDRGIITIAEAVAVSTLSDTTIRRAIKDKKLPVKRIGRRILIRRVDLDEFLKPS